MRVCVCLTNNLFLIQNKCSEEWELAKCIAAAKSLQSCATPSMAARQAPPSLGFSRQEHWHGLPFPSPMHESEKRKWSRSVVPDSSRPHGLQPTSLFRPWDFPGKSAGVGCHCRCVLIWALQNLSNVDAGTPFFFSSYRNWGLAGPSDIPKMEQAGKGCKDLSSQTHDLSLHSIHFPWIHFKNPQESGPRQNETKMKCSCKIRGDAPFCICRSLPLP